MDMTAFTLCKENDLPLIVLNIHQHGAVTRAIRGAANGEAAALYARALQLWDRVTDAEALTGHDNVELLRSAASQRAIRPR